MSKPIPAPPARKGPQVVSFPLSNPDKPTTHTMRPCQTRTNGAWVNVHEARSAARTDRYGR